MKVETGSTKQNHTYPVFRGPLDGLLTQTLITIDTNPMVNAALIDIFAMVIPRTYVDTKERNKYAGTETFLRELAGTFIVCLSSGIFAKWIARLYNKLYKPEIKINPNSWVSDSSLALMHHSWTSNKGNTYKYVSDILSNLRGNDGKEISRWRNIDWKHIEWTDDKNWTKFKWNSAKFNNIQNRLKSEEGIVQTLNRIIEEDYSPKDVKQVLKIVEHRIVNALKAGNSVNARLEDKSLDTSVNRLLRDMYDLGKNVFKNKNINVESAIEKLQKSNKVKTLGALAIASTLGLSNQYINRQITKKRTGTDAFVGEVDYDKIKESKICERKNNPEFWLLKILASTGIVALAAIVMKIKSPKDFIKKLEFTSAITSGNAIKTVYTATLAGRFLAASNETELRESVTRDYLGFLNWLVFGGFVAKGVANLLDRNQSKLFNIHKEGKGIKHWLSEISLKSHAEIAAKGNDFAKKNIWKLNLAHGAGLIYSTVALGILLPLLNVAVTRHRHNKIKEKNADRKVQQ